VWKGALRESLPIQPLARWAGAASQAPSVHSPHPAGMQMPPGFLALTFPVLCINPFYFPFAVG